MKDKAKIVLLIIINLLLISLLFKRSFAKGDEEPPPPPPPSAQPSAEPSAEPSTESTVKSPEIDYLQHQGNFQGAGLVYNGDSDYPWNQEYKFTCKNRDGIESEESEVYGPISHYNWHKPTIRIKPNIKDKPCEDGDSLVIYVKTPGYEWHDLTEEPKDRAQTWSGEALAGKNEGYFRDLRDFA